MAENRGSSELQAREAEAEEARARLANTLVTLTSPETQEAVKAELLSHVEGYKDTLLKQADHYKDELLQKADEYKNELLNRAETYKHEALQRAEQYKGEFLSRADEYKNEALQRAEDYKDEALQRARDAGRDTIHNVVDDLKTRAMNSPAAVALIAAGVGWRLYKHPPITTLLVGAGAALLMRAPGRSSQDDRASYRDPYRRTQPRGYVPGGVAGYGYPVEENAPGSSTTEQMAAMASSLGERARDVAFEAGSRMSDIAERTSSTITRTAGDTLDRVGGLASTVRHNPLLMALVGLAAGVAVARSVRATETGDRFVRSGTNMLGRGARGMSSRVSNAAGQAIEAVAGVATAAASTVGDVATTVRTRVPEVASGLTDAAGRALGAVSYATSTTSAEDRPAGARPPHQKGNRHPQGRRKRYQPGVGQRVGREVVQMAQQYPLLLSTAGLLLGAAAGVALRTTDAEDRYVGPASDVLKRRVKETVSGQFGQAVAAADEVISSVEDHLGKGAEARQGSPLPAEHPEPVVPSTGAGDLGGIDKETVVVERAQDAVAAQVSLSRNKSA